MRKLKLSDAFIMRWGGKAALVVILVMVAFILSVLFSGCKKDPCYTCSTSDDATGYIWDVEYLCGIEDKENYIITFTDADNTAECILNE